MKALALGDVLDARKASVRSLSLTDVAPVGSRMVLMDVRLCPLKMKDNFFVDHKLQYHNRDLKFSMLWVA